MSKSSASGQLKTKTLPDDRSDGFFEGPDPVTWIHIAGTVHQFELPKGRKRITVGSSPDCDIVVPSEYISRHHCTLERHFDSIRVVDHSKNGTFVDARRVGDSMDIRAGQVFGAGGGITFLALNDEMRRVYPLLCDLLDWETETSLVPPPPRWATPAYAIRIASGVDHVMISGDAGCDQDQLARAIHAISPLRKRELLWVDSIPEDRAAQKKLLVRATRSTMVLTIDDKMPIMDEAFRSSFFSTSYRIRVIVIASPRRAQEVLGDQAYMRRIELRPLAFRTDQIGRLLDRQLEQRGSPLRFAQLTEHNRQVLLRYEWRRKNRREKDRRREQHGEWVSNFDELRIAADRLAAITRERTLRKAAAALGEDRWAVQYWASNVLGLKLPLTG